MESTSRVSGVQARAGTTMEYTPTYSAASEFYDIPVSGIIQYFGLYGFSVAERFTCIVWGMPIFIHSQGVKPWLTGSSAKPGGFRRKVDAAYLDLSPYILAASALAPIDTRSWTRPRSALSSALRNIGFGYAPLVGFPIAVAFDLARMASRTMRYLKSISIGSIRRR
jgi:hypothetical protein